VPASCSGALELFTLPGANKLLKLRAPGRLLQLGCGHINPDKSPHPPQGLSSPPPWKLHRASLFRRAYGWSTPAPSAQSSFCQTWRGCGSISCCLT